MLFSSRSNLIMTHTLTAFMQLMDHGIVSWENLSSIFIKKVSARQPPSASPLWTQTRHCAFLFWRSRRPPPSLSAPPRPLSDCQLCQRQAHGCLHTAGVARHPGEHGAEQPQPLPAGQTGNHHGEAGRSPAGVSVGSAEDVWWILFFFTVKEGFLKFSQSTLKPDSWFVVWTVESNCSH